MVQRILLDTTSGIKISKPGYDVLSALSDDQLIVDGSKHGLGMALTGTATVTPRTRVNIPYSNPYGTIPYVLVQYDSGAGYAIGGGMYGHFYTEGSYQDTSPPYYLYTTSTQSDSVGLDVWVTTSNISIFSAHPSTRTVRYVVFFAAQADGTGGGSYDSVPDAMDWTNISGTANNTELANNTQTVAGIGGPIGIGVSCSPAMASGQTLRVKVNGSTANSISGGSSSTSITAQLGDQIGFAIIGTSSYTGTITVSNLTAGGTIDTFTISVSAAPNYGVTANWPNTSFTGNSGGGSWNQFADSGTTIGGTLNTTVTLQVQANRNLLSNEALQVYVNSVNVATINAGQQAVTFSVTLGASVVFRHAYFTGSTPVTTFSIYNISASNAFVDSYTSQITDTYVPAPDVTPDAVNWNDVSGETYNNQTCIRNTNTVTIGGINQTITLRLIMNNTLPSGTSIAAWINGSEVSSISSGSNTLDCSVVNGDTLFYRFSKAGAGNYTDSGAVYNLSDGSAVIDSSISANLTVNSGPPL